MPVQTFSSSGLCVDSIKKGSIICADPIEEHIQCAPYVSAGARATAYNL